MESIKTVKDSNSLARILRESGTKHINYRIYTSMENALDILLTGDIFLSNGSKWNDESDRTIMENKKVYAKSFSYSTSENIAMWMLYGGEKGIKGASLNFYPSVIKDLINSEVIKLGYFFDNHFEEVENLTNKDVDIFMTDLVYYEDCSNEQVKITHAEDHTTVSKMCLDNQDIFYKKYPWKYENECRLVVQINKQLDEEITKKCDTVKLSLSKENISKMRKDRLTKSPVYSGNVSSGQNSQLRGEVKFNW